MMCYYYVLMFYIAAGAGEPEAASFGSIAYMTPAAAPATKRATRRANKDVLNQLTLGLPLLSKSFLLHKFIQQGLCNCTTTITTTRASTAEPAITRRLFPANGLKA